MHLALVLVEARALGAEDRQVDVDQQLGVAALGHGVVAGGHDERVDAFGRRIARAGRLQRLPRPVGAARFVVMRMHVVDRIVEPQRQRDFAGAFGERLFPVEPREAFAQVLHRVVVALRLAVAALQFEPQCVVGRGHAQRVPGGGPVRVQRLRCHRGYCSIAALTSWPRSSTDIA
ncbi:hypothetical protein D9M72_560520 [compost metagenome]